MNKMVIKKLYWYLFFFILTIISFYFDKFISHGFSFIRNSVLNQVLLAFTFITNEFIVLAFLTFILFYVAKKKEWIIPLWVTFALASIVSIILKIVTQRLRPFQQGLLATLPVLAKMSHFSWNLSFPSFNTMIMFCALPIIAKQYPKLKKTWIILAILVALTRVYFGIHFLSDVLAGGLIGYLIGIWVVRLETKKKYFNRFTKKVKKLVKKFI